MSITKDFENKETVVLGAHFFRRADVYELLAHTRKLEAMLKELEWCADSDGGDAICPECGNPKIRWLVKGRHDEYCKLAKLLEGVK